MKTIFALALLVGSSSYAQTEIAAGDQVTALSNIEARLVSQEPLCPADAICITNGTVVNLDFTLMGCLDKLGPVTYHTEEDTKNNVLNVYVSAVNIHTKASQSTMCYKAPVEKLSLTLIMKFGKVNLINLTPAN